MSRQSAASPRHRLAETEEITIFTQRSAESPAHRTTIWVVVVGDVVYVRSVRGKAGRWYKEITANPVGAIHLPGERISVHAVPVTDNKTIEQVSQEYLRKYHGSEYAPAMVRHEVLDTTLRLDFE
jgi:hypothetical protein